MKVQPAIELQERPGTAPQIQDLNQETVLDHQVNQERSSTPIAWVEDKVPVNDDIPVPPSEGMHFKNPSAVLDESQEIKEQTDRPNVITAWNEDKIVTDRRDSIRSRSTTGDGLNILNPQAYIPYHVAKRNITRVIEDMKMMRKNHNKALKEVNRIYREIEEETQVFTWYSILMYVWLITDILYNFR